jgi:threonine dehydratase
MDAADPRAAAVAVASGAAADTDLAVSLDDIVAAEERLRPYVHRTPLLTCTTLSRLAGCELTFKAEHLQRGGSFKLRGALNRLLLLSPDERARGVVAFSSGNHAQGVALAARLLGIPATLVMPSDAPRVKLEATAGYGAEIVTYDRQREDREAIAARLSTERGATLVPPFDDPRVIAGQGTIGLELAAQQPDLEVALIPIGGGGLAGGMARALKARCPGIRIIGVEPEVAADAQASVREGRIVRIRQPATIADGVATQAVGRYTFPLLRALLDDIVTVREGEIAKAMVLLMERAKQVVEPTGAVATAAAIFGAASAYVPGKRVMALLCGGNLDLAALPRVLALAS